MRLIFLGTGSAFTVGDGNYQSNMILEADSGRKLLIDCGTDIRFALYEQGLSYHDISDVYISHLHADHVGGLEWLAFTTKYDLSCHMKPHLHIRHELVDSLWNHTLSGGLGSLDDKTISLRTYFEVNATVKDAFFWEGYEFKLFAAPHSMTGCHVIANCGLSYGFSFVAGGKNILVTTDIKFERDYMRELYEWADIIFQDCETSIYKSTVHAHYTELVTLSPAIKNKMWLYHYQAGVLPDAKGDGFRGFVKKGQSFEF